MAQIPPGVRTVDKGHSWLTTFTSGSTLAFMQNEPVTKHGMNTVRPTLCNIQLLWEATAAVALLLSCLKFAQNCTVLRSPSYPVLPSSPHRWCICGIPCGLLALPFYCLRHLHNKSLVLPILSNFCSEDPV